MTSHNNLPHSLREKLLKATSYYHAGNFLLSEIKVFNQKTKYFQII